MVRAGNRGPFTLDGTRTYLVGEEQVAVIDPGPDVAEHIRALSHALESASEVHILLTHRHSDHSGGAPGLARRLGVPVYAPAGYSLPTSAPPSESAVVLRTLTEGAVVSTDAGDLLVVPTPGHAPEHVAFHWPNEEAIFVGDLVLGKGVTTWVGEYLGCVEDYLQSLDRILSLEPGILYPTHGPPVRNPPATIRRFRAHRLKRLREVQKAREAYPEAGADELARRIYGGDVPEKLAEAACSAVEAALFHLDGATGEG